MFKYLLLLSLLAMHTVAGFSQFKKGNRMAGATVGSIFYNSGKSEYSFPPPTTGFVSNTSNYGINFGPSMGWFISDNTAIGVSLLFSINNSKISDVSDATGNIFNKDDSKRFNIGLGGFVRNYFNSTGNLKPFGQANLNFGTGSASSKGFTFSGGDKSSYDGKSSGDFFVNAGLNFGFTKMLNDHTGIDLFAGYNYSYTKSNFKRTTTVDLGNNGTIDQTSTSNPTQKYTNHGAILGISFQIFLDGKKK